MHFRPPRPLSMTLNLAPLVDVMMCLIIFFLLASKLVSAQNRPLRLPYARSAELLDPSELGSRIVVNVRASSADPLRAEYITQGWDGRNIVDLLVAPEELAPLLASRKAQAESRGDSLRCVIRAEKTLAAGHVETVMRACGLAKVAHVVFAANAGDEPEPRP